ncbi:MAG TPA: reverse transcriptase-like protein, partial [Puia sp.]|nr:reverse transcriptase-like protein [Puia sp.]
QRPSDEEIRAFTAAAVAQVKSNYNLRGKNQVGSPRQPEDISAGQLMHGHKGTEPQKRQWVNNKQNFRHRTGHDFQGPENKTPQAEDQSRGSQDRNDDQGTMRMKAKSAQDKSKIVEQATTAVQNCAPFDIAQILTQVKVSVPLMELMKVEEIKNRTISLISGVPFRVKQNDQTQGEKQVMCNEEDETPEVYLGMTMTKCPSQVEPFYVSLVINGKIIRNCMLDSGASTNVMPLAIMQQAGLKIDKACGKCYAMDAREVPVIGIMKDVDFKLAAFPEKRYKMNITVVGIKPQYGMLLSRRWAALIGGSMQLDLSYAMIPMNGRDVKLIREQRSSETVEDQEANEQVCFVDTDCDNFKVVSDDAKDKKKNACIEELDQQGLWTMFFDGACAKEGSGAGVVFLSPTGKLLKSSFLLRFDCTNNIAEYEALLLGLNIALKHGIKMLRV